MLDLYVETTVHLAPSTSDSVITLSLPSANSLSILSRTTPPRVRSAPLPAPAKDEATYIKQSLASEGSIYFRQAKAYPRTFIWRVLEGNKILELRCADLARSEHEVDEALLTVRFEVQDLIIPEGVALSDAEGEDALHVFIVTYRKELQTLAVPLDFFRNAVDEKGDIRRWCKTFAPSSFTIDNPHRLYAHTPFELFVSLDSGRLQRLTRKAEDDGSYWKQDNFDDTSWGASFRGMVKWRNNQFISHDSRSLSQTTANAMIASSDSTHLYTICLNHTLRVWGLTTGKLVVSKDLLDRPIRPQDPHTILSPATSSFLRLYKVGLMDHPILVTFSPHNEGQFKFWDVRGGLTEQLTVEDRFPNLSLRPPDPDPSGNTIWSLAGFEIRPGSIDEPTELWILWRNNNFCQVYSLHFDLQDLSESWETNWVKTHTSVTSRAIAPDLVRHDPLDATEKWMKFLFWPHRYPASVLETALSIYQDAMRIKAAPPKSTKPLPERLCASIASGVSIRKYNESELDYVRFTCDTDAQWRNFWRIAEAINEKRKSPISLAFDVYAGMAWVLQSDQCCAVRECNDLELVRYNSRQPLQSLGSIMSVRWPYRKGITEESQTIEKMTQLLEIADSFSRSFSPELTRDCETALAAELLEEAEYPIPNRLNDLYERCNFGDAITNETYEKVLHGVEVVGGLQTLRTELIPAILALLPESVRGSHPALRSTIFGSNVVDAGLSDTITLGRQVMYNLFFLMVFLGCEVDQEENTSDEFGPYEMFSTLLDVLKEYEKKMWLLSHVRECHVEFSEDSEDSPTEHKPLSSAQSLQRPVRQVNLLRDTKGKDIKPQPAVGSPQSYLLTEMLNDVEAWVGGASEISPNDGCVWIQCDLLAHGNIDLATDFSRFQPNTPWSTYVKGRLCLARNEYEQAALYFQKAAHPLGESLHYFQLVYIYADLALARGKAVGMLSDMSAGLLTIDDTDHFNSGMSRYFHHILALFESAEAYSFAADFARLAVAAAPHDHLDCFEDYKDEIVSSLFAAELRCSRYVPAYAALTLFSNEKLQKSSAIAWTDAILGQRSLPRLEAGETIHLLQKLPLDLHPHVARVADDHLTMLAQKQASVPGLSSRIWSSDNGTDYVKILYTLRVGRHDYRGALSVLMDRLRLIKKSGQARNDPGATALRHTLLALINTLSCVAPDEAYILTPITDSKADTTTGQWDAEGRDLGTGWKPRKRIIITLEDLRREYQQLLDKCSRIERGDFDFDPGTEDEEGGSEFEGATITNGMDAMEF
jgi:nuclear pore complex protein Nup160